MTREELRDYVEFLRSQNEISYEAYSGLIDGIDTLEQEQKAGCEGCIYEKTGNNSTYPCSHCSRCYTNKYKSESEG